MSDIITLLPWRPIEELYDEDGEYDHDNDCADGLLLLAPELEDADCNTYGVGLGFYQDDGLMWHASQEECDNWPDDRPTWQLDGVQVVHD